MPTTGKLNDEYGTPLPLFEYLSYTLDFQFTLDPCAAEHEQLPVAESYVGARGVDGLTAPWLGSRVYINPPYSNPGPWMERAYTETRLGRVELAVALVQAKTDTNWWHHWVMHADTIFLIRGRIRFVTPPGQKQYGQGRFPSVLVVWRGVPGQYRMDSVKGPDIRGLTLTRAQRGITATEVAA